MRFELRNGLPGALLPTLASLLATACAGTSGSGDERSSDPVTSTAIDAGTAEGIKTTPASSTRDATAILPPRALTPTTPLGKSQIPGGNTDGGGAEGGDAALAEGGPVDGGADVVSSGPFGSWRPLANVPPFSPSVGLVLTDGTVMVMDYQEGSKWWRLTPDKTGSYLAGTWSQTAQMPSGYQPIFFSSAVLKDGRMLVMGGEYNEGTDIETPLGAIYDPVADVWAPVQAPTPLDTWYLIGDAQSVVLADGTFMIGSISGEALALFDARTLSWTTVGATDAGFGKADFNSEEGWTLLPNGKVLTVDVGVNLSGTTTNSELYDPATRSWSSAGSTGVQLAAGSPTYEIGPAVLMPNGSVFATGATGSTSVYAPDGTWTPGPSFPATMNGQLDIADGCAALLPNGNVLSVASPGAYETGSAFFEFDGTNLTEVASTQNLANDSSFNVFLLLLPTGQVLATDYSSDLELYTATGAPDPSWAPTITQAPTEIVRGTTYRIEGTQFNGLSQAVSYGDDYQGATNYPLVRVTNDATGDVQYGRTHDHSTMGVATGSAPVSTLFEVPSQAETGASTLVVVANGIPSDPVPVTIQ